MDGGAVSGTSGASRWLCNLALGVLPQADAWAPTGRPRSHSPIATGGDPVAIEKITFLVRVFPLHMNEELIWLMRHGSVHPHRRGLPPCSEFVRVVCVQSAVEHHGF